MHAAARTGHRTDRRDQDDQTETGPLARSDDTPGRSGAIETHAAERSGNPGHSEETVRAALVSALESPEFRSAPQLRSFLDFIVHAALEQNREKIKGYTIAVEALGRSEDFNPVTDPIVRVEAARLRRRLAKYYAGTGASERVRIVIPKGSYAPEFEAKPQSVIDEDGSSPSDDVVTIPASQGNGDAGATSEMPVAADTAGTRHIDPEDRNVEASPLHTYKEVRPLSGSTTQPLFRKHVPLPVALMLALACFLAGLLAGSL
nr:hypothetical protein [uncultured Roseibium sp.]